MESLLDIHHIRIINGCVGSDRDRTKSGLRRRSVGATIERYSPDPTAQGTQESGSKTQLSRSCSRMHFLGPGTYHTGSGSGTWSSGTRARTRPRTSVPRTRFAACGSETHNTGTGSRNQFSGPSTTETQATGYISENSNLGNSGSGIHYRRSEPRSPLLVSGSETHIAGSHSSISMQSHESPLSISKNHLSFPELHRPKGSSWRKRIHSASFQGRKYFKEPQHSSRQHSFIPKSPQTQSHPPSPLKTNRIFQNIHRNRIDNSSRNSGFSVSRTQPHTMPKLRAVLASQHMKNQRASEDVNDVRSNQTLNQNQDSKNQYLKSEHKFGINRNQFYNKKYFSDFPGSGSSHQFSSEEHSPACGATSSSSHSPEPGYRDRGETSAEEGPTLKTTHRQHQHSVSSLDVAPDQHLRSQRSHVTIPRQCSHCGPHLNTSTQTNCQAECSVDTASSDPSLNTTPEPYYQSGHSLKIPEVSLDPSFNTASEPYCQLGHSLKIVSLDASRNTTPEHSLERLLGEASLEDSKPEECSPEVCHGVGVDPKGVAPSIEVSSHWEEAPSIVLSSQQNKAVSQGLDIDGELTQTNSMLNIRKSNYVSKEQRSSPNLGSPNVPENTRESIVTSECVMKEKSPWWENEEFYPIVRKVLRVRNNIYSQTCYM